MFIQALWGLLVFKASIDGLRGSRFLILLEPDKNLNVLVAAPVVPSIQTSRREGGPGKETASPRKVKGSRNCGPAEGPRVDSKISFSHRYRPS